jgi:hypothetical protein
LVVFVNLIQGRQVGYEFDVMELSGGVEEVGCCPVGGVQWFRKRGGENKCKV